MSQRVVVWVLMAGLLTGCSASARQFEQAAGDFRARLQGAATDVREFVSPGSEAFQRGQRYLDDKNLPRAAAAFAEARKRAPDNKEYSDALRKVREQIVQDGMAEARHLPATAVLRRISTLEGVAAFDDGSSVSNLLRRVREERDGLRVHASAIVSLSAGEPALALDRVAPLVEYAPELPEIDAARKAVLERRNALIEIIQGEKSTGKFEDAKDRIVKLLKLDSTDLEARSLGDEIDAAIQNREEMKRRAEFQRLVALGQSAQAAGALAIAHEYYGRGKAVSAADTLSVDLDALEAQILKSRPRRAALFSDSIPRDYRAVIAELVTRELGREGLSFRIEEHAAGAAEAPDFVLEIQLVDLQWKVDAGDPEKVWSTYLAGYNKLPNSAYHQALANYQKVLHDDTVTRATATGLIGALAIIISANNVKKAGEALNSTPQYIDEPNYQNYSYARRVIREHGRVVIRVALIDDLNKQRYATEDITVEHDSTHVEIVGAHPEDRGRVQNVSYLPSTSHERQDSLRTKALSQTASKVVALAVDAERFRADDYLTSGALREGVETRLRYGQLLQRSARRANDGAGVIAGVWSTHLAAGFPESGQEVVDRTRAARTLPLDSLLARQAARVSTADIVSNPPVSRVVMSPEDIVKRVGPAVATVRTFVGQGSGFFVDKRGLLFTNAHVLSGARDVAVILADGTQYMASIVFRDERRDTGILKVEGAAFPELPLRTGDPLSVGEAVLAVGAPLGLQNTVTQGIVSGVRAAGDIAKGLSLDPQLRLVQTDAAINSGNSGGPLVDRYGAVVGMNSFKRRASEGLGFAISSSELRLILDSLPSTAASK